MNIRGRTCGPATGPPGLEHPGGRSPGRGQTEKKGVDLVGRVQGSAKRRRLRRRAEREASQGEHEQEQAEDGKGDEEDEPF